jgi:hypothetical protein
MAQNTKHVDHVFWICRLENQASYAQQLAAICDTEFHGPVDRPDLGTRIYISWRSGLEIIAPLEETTIYSVSLTEHLAKRGEGLLGVIFGIADIEEGRKRAIRLGYAVSPVIEHAGHEPYLGETEVMKEIVVGDFMNSSLVFGEIRYPKGVAHIVGD